jgi:hypothetical protein
MINIFTSRLTLNKTEKLIGVVKSVETQRMFRSRSCWFLFRLFFDLQDGGSMFLGWHSTDYTNSTRHNSFHSYCFSEKYSPMSIFIVKNCLKEQSYPFRRRVFIFGRRPFELRISILLDLSCLVRLRVVKESYTWHPPCKCFSYRTGDFNVIATVYSFFGNQ